MAEASSLNGGGQIVGGTIGSANGSSLQVVPRNASTQGSLAAILDGVTLNTDVVISPSCLGLRLRGAWHNNATIHANGTLADWTNEGQINLHGGAVAITGDTFTNAASGVISRVGTFDVSSTTFDNQGTISPGLSPGALTILGDLVQSGTGRLVLEIGAEASDMLEITGVATLGGTLEIRVLGGFHTAPGETLTLLKAAGLVGAFEAVDFVGGDGEVTFDTSSGQIFVTQVVPEPMSALMLLGVGGMCVKRRSA